MMNLKLLRDIRGIYTLIWGIRLGTDYVQYLLRKLIIFTWEEWQSILEIFRRETRLLILSFKA